MPDNYTFSLKEIKLENGDHLYLYTDGVVDQFGGKDGKKFMSRRLFNLIQEHAHREIDEQKKEIENTITRWKNKFEQIDDILIIGIKYQA